MPDVDIVSGPTIWRRSSDSSGAVHRADFPNVRYECPCCCYPTLDVRGGYEICVLCGWEDDGQDDPKADEVRGGPNHDYSLNAARQNFKLFLTQHRAGETRWPSDRVEARAGRQRLVDTFEQLKSTADEAQRQRLWDAARKLEDEVHELVYESPPQGREF